MTSLKDRMGEKVHTRKIEITTYSLKEESDSGIIVEGHLVDERHMHHYMLSGEKRDPGILHDLVIRMLVSGPPATIEDIETGIRTVPRQECRETADSLDFAKGMPISSGFTMKIKEMQEKGTGCSHLTALFLAMAPAALQGFWSYTVRNPIPEEITGGMLRHHLMDVCHVWRKDGPAMQELAREPGGNPKA